MPSRITKLRNAFQDMVRQGSGEWLDKQAGWFGDLEGNVDAGKGMVNVRLYNGKVIQALNRVAPGRPNMPVRIGRSRSLPNVWQVIEVRNVFDEYPGEDELPYHHEQHEERGPDRLNLNRKQIMGRTVRVKDSAAFIVRVFSDPDLTANGYVLIGTQDIDLSSYVPATGALYVAIESSDTGALSVHAGTGFSAPGVGTASNYPVPAAGKYTRALILFFEGQTALLDEHIVIPMPPSFNPTAIPAGSHLHSLDDLDDVSVPSPTDGQVLTYDFYSGEWIAADATGGGGGVEKALVIVMHPDLTDPCVPVLSPDGDNYVYLEVEL